MQRENRLAVFEHVPPKKQPSPTKCSLKQVKRNRSPEPQCESKNVKRGKRGLYIAEEDLILHCEFEGCNYTISRYYDFLKHLGEHIEERTNESDFDSDCSCTWTNCEYVGKNLNYLKIHLTYHGYHTRLKAIGSNALIKLKLPDCKEDELKFPSLPEYYACEWDHCNTILWSYQVFIDHIKCHVNALPKKVAEKDGLIRCGWTGCSNTYTFQYKLLDHIRSHTKEKSIACPTCGAMFSCRTKFYDHRKRQLSVDLQGYQCSQCSKLFASERLLRDHMRIHINHYKCHLCDMTCTKPSALAKHIRYRHLPERLFKCDICTHSTITHQDLIRHRETHSQEKTMECLSCGYKCRSKYTMDKHLKQHDGTWGLNYACHCCDKRFAMGTLLTKHLIKVHDFHWPSGHSRFSYKQDTKTGLYHLQVVRYESLEVTQEMMQDNIPYQFQSSEDCKFECVQNKPLSYVLKLSSNNKRNTTLHNIEDIKSKTAYKKEKRNSNNDVTVKEVDIKGNVKAGSNKTENCT